MERSRIQVTKDKILADMAYREEVRQSRKGFYMWRQEQTMMTLKEVRPTVVRALALQA